MHWLVLIFVLISMPVVAETIHIEGPLGPLAGELVLAEGAEALVVIVPGSGPTDRDGNSVATGLRSDT